MFALNHIDTSPGSNVPQLQEHQIRSAGLPTVLKRSAPAPRTAEVQMGIRPRAVAAPPEQVAQDTATRLISDTERQKSKWSMPENIR